MLVLTSQEHEAVYLDLPDGTRIVVRVVDVGGKKVRLGFTAPASVKIVREAVLRREAAARAAKGG